MQRTIALLVIMVSLAGCGGDDGGSTSTTGPGAKVSVPAPTWAPGDWWSVTDTMGRAYSVVVAGEAGGDWLVLSNELSIALADYRFDISYLGNVRKSDLAGQQGGDRPAYFDWPLEHNKTWTTRWDGASRTLVAHAADDGRFHISGRDSGALAVEYIYNPAVRWLDKLTFYNVTGDGEVQYSWTRDGAGQGFTGSLYRYTDVREALRVEQDGPGNPQGQIQVPEGTSEMVVTTTLVCPQGSVNGALGIATQAPQDDGSGQPLPPVPPPAPSTNVPTYGEFGQCPAIDNADDPLMELVEEPRVGTWRYDGIVADDDASLTFVIEQRTYETLNF